ncbi:MAG: hypothetical protein DRP65_11215 [Planctomycetota bacterium]|nr:MAG: hypothetical protein DRP65_11215 [Planctomycetota bacterium]
MKDKQGAHRTGNRTANKPAPVSTPDKSLSADTKRTGGGDHRQHRKSSRVRFEERGHAIKHAHRYEHVYRDRHHRIRHRIIWPRYYYPVYYDWGPYFTFRYVYPYYHRRYVFVSLGGYWPVHYRYIRYYWYPSHAYDWYGYHPIAREVQSDTYNYYTYNYYYDDTTSPAYSTRTTQPLTTVDENTFADVRAKLAAQAEAPDAQTLADTCFEEAVKAFEDADYDTAADKFAEAMALAPDDMVLPFAYVQALFADKKYLQAAEALRRALAKVPTDQEGVFYPRGLYPEEDILFEQIDELTEAVPLRGFDPDLQLLLGYQLLGVGDLEPATETLRQAGLNATNTTSATILLNLLEKIKMETKEGVNQKPLSGTK